MNGFKKNVVFTVIGGKNLLKQAPSNVYGMREEKKIGEGVVWIKGKHYYLLGVHKEEKYSRNIGKAAAGAVIGGVLTGGVGAIVGGAIGGKQKDKSTYFVDLMDYETKQEFTIEVAVFRQHAIDLTTMKIANIENPE